MPLPQEILESIPAEYRENETLKRFNDVGDLAKSYVESRSLLGRSIRIPTEDAPPEDREEFYNKLINNAPDLMKKPDMTDPEQAEAFYKLYGRPDDPAEYKKPEGLSIHEEAEAELRNVFHKAGLNNQQFETVFAELAGTEAARQEALAEKRTTQETELRGKWGVTYDERTNAAKRINEEFYPGRDFEQLSHPEIEALYNVHVSLTGKPAQAASQEPGQTSGMTPDEARDRAADLLRKAADPELPADERMKLVNKSIELKRKFVPEFADTR